MKVIYIAGPYTAPCNWQIQENINRAMAAGKLVADMGAMPLIPHSNTPLVFCGLKDPKFWYDGTMELMRRSDAILLIEGWEDSTGSCNERTEAVNRNVPVFFKQMMVHSKSYRDEFIRFCQS